MPLSTFSVFEIRPSVGNDLNGGGFVKGASGTDYSQQDSAQVSYTDLVIGATTTQLTSAATPFTSAHVGNVVSVNSGTGFTVSLYEVVSVAASVATMDRAVGTANSTAGAGRLGGAHNSFAPFATMNGANMETVKVFIKATGTITLINVMQTGSRDVRLTGYTSARTDRGRVTVTTSTNSTSLFNMQPQRSKWLVENLILTNTAVTRASLVRGASETASFSADNCIFDGGLYALDFGGAFIQAFDNFWTSMLDCEVKNCTSHAMRFFDTRLVIAGCYVHDNAGDGVRVDGNSVRSQVSVISSIFYNNTGFGLNIRTAGDMQIMAALLLVNSAFVSNGGGGVRQHSDGTPFPQFLTMVNNLFINNTGNGIQHATNSGDDGTYQMGRNNGFFGNTTAARKDVDVLPGDFNLTASPFVNAVSGNFVLNETAGGGVLCKELGFPGVLIAGGTGYASVGPLVPSSAAPSGGSVTNT